jgi:hypothetical protein
MKFDVNRVANDIYQLRIKKGETWGTAEGDYQYAVKLCEKWEKELEDERREKE